MADLNRFSRMGMVNAYLVREDDESARALRALAPARLAAGHGRLVESPLDAMDRAIARGC